MKTFTITNLPIDTNKLRMQLCNEHCGAYASFEGWVRNHNESRGVSYLEYEAHEALCESESLRIFEEVKEKFDVKGVSCVHRTGKLTIGEMAVWVGVTAAHRDAAFQACRYVIDESKKRLPIWKKEFYEDGDSGWINCSSGEKKLSENTREKDFYSRQSILKDIGPGGQQKLKNAKVLVVGAGGLGSSALFSLAAAGAGTIGICEYDKLDISNLHRQVLYSFKDVGKAKIDLAEYRIKQLNPFITVNEHPCKLDPQNVEGVIHDYDIVLDCTDNFVTKFLLNDACVLNNKTLVQASIYQYEGQLRVQTSKLSGCLRCLWPDIPEANCVGTCAEAGVLGTVPSIFGNMQAHEAIKFIVGLKGVLAGETVIMNFTTYELNKIAHLKSKNCPLCGNNPTITQILSENYEQPKNFSVDINSLSKSLIDEFTFVDIREAHERVFSPVKQIDHIHLPLSKLQREKFLFNPDKKYVIFCSKGMRSRSLTQKLHQKGINNTYSLENGVEAIYEYYKN